MVAVGPVLALGLPDVAAASLGTALYFGILLALRAIPVELIQALREWRGTPAGGKAA